MQPVYEHVSTSSCFPEATFSVFLLKGNVSSGVEEQPYRLALTLSYGSPSSSLIFTSAPMLRANRKL